MPKKSNAEKSRLLFKIGSLYYLRSHSQQEISDKLGISRPMVSRLLKQAREEGIVQINVLPPAGNHLALEEALENKFGLDEAIIVETGFSDSQSFISRQIGVVASDYFLRTLKNNDIIGLTWGTTIRSLVDAVHPIESKNVRIVQILGGLGRPESDLYPSSLCSRLASLLNCSFTILPSPGVAGSKETKGLYLSDAYVVDALNIINKINVAYVGIGSMAEDSITVKGNILTPEDREYLISQGAVGDIGLRFFDIFGNPVMSNFDERVIGVSLDQIKNFDHVVGLAGGPEKYEAVLGVLRGRFLNVLITDNTLAMKLVEEN